MTGLAVAVVGATGAVGQEFLAVLAQRRFPIRSLRLLASPRSAGAQVAFCGEQLRVEALTPESFRGIELALFSAGGAVARQAAPWAVGAGALVVDNSSAFRMDAQVPLVVPEVNAAAAREHRGIIANPNCSTIILCVALAPLHRAFGLERVVVSTYQAASGAGARAMAELRETSADVLAGRTPVARQLPQVLAFNLFPQVDVFQDPGPDTHGYTREEDKMQHETRKILALPALPVEATCVRVPVLRCHSEAVTVALARPASAAAAARVLADAPGLTLMDHRFGPGGAPYPMPSLMSGADPVAVGRIRASRVFDPGLGFWLVGDQLRKGAALNAVQIAEALLLTASTRPHPVV